MDRLARHALPRVRVQWTRRPPLAHYRGNFPQPELHTGWTLVLFHIENDVWGAQFLVDIAPRHLLQIPGQRLDLYEGFRLAATCTVEGPS